MEEPTSLLDLFENDDLEAPSQRPEWPALSMTPTEKTSSTARTIQPGQRIPETTAIPTPWSQKMKISEDYAKDRVGKYAQYFQKDRILPIPELVKAVEPKTLSFIFSYTRTRSLAGLKKEIFKGLLKTAGVPSRYFCRRSFSIWDVLLPLEDLAKKLAVETITVKSYQLQPEYRDHRKIKVTVCNSPTELKVDVLASYLSDYGNIEEVLPARSAAETAHGDYIIYVYK